MIVSMDRTHMLEDLKWWWGIIWLQALCLFKKSTRSMFTVLVLILNELTVSGKHSTAGHETKERLKGEDQYPD